MNSCLYECTVMHHRLEPRPYRFVHKVFSFALDLDEIEALGKRLHFLGVEKFSLFSFRAGDHLRYPGLNLKESIREYLRSQRIDFDRGRIMLVTNLRTFGYVFNPVSFYFCFDEADRPLCAIAEVNNTFGEMKPYFLGPEHFEDGVFRLRTPKHFYISPFTDLDLTLDLALRVPGERADFRVDDYRDGQAILKTAMLGARWELNDTNLLRFAFRYPLLTLRVIVLIHWHALKLFLNRIPYHKKQNNPDLQRGIFDGTPKL